MDEQESLEVTAKTVKEAIDRALQRLGRTLDQVNITVLSEGSRGILGIGSEDARILVSVKEEVAPPVEETPVEVNLAAAPEAARGQGGERDRGDHDRGDRSKPADEESLAAGQRVLESLLLRMRIFADVEVVQREDGPVLNVVGDDVGLLIGRRGNTLASLQFMTNMIVAKRVRKWSRLTVDVENYRLRREATLTNLAQRMAERVQQTGMPATLEAMPAGERRIIHMALAHHSYVTTGSIGEGEDRKVVISPRR